MFLDWSIVPAPAHSSTWLRRLFLRSQHKAMSNSQPFGAQPSSANESFQLLDPKSQTQPQGITRVLKGQVLLTAGGAIYAAMNLNPMGLGACLLSGGLACLSLNWLSRWQTSILQLRQQLRSQTRELARLTAVNHSLSEQLNHQPDLADQLTQAEAAVLQSEKMATLGMLMAGVAHEINTPLGAIQASAENLDFSMGQTLQYLPQLCRCLGEDQLMAWAQLLTWAEQDKGNRSSRQERQLKRELQAKLEALNLENGRSIAAILSPMGIEQDLAPILPILMSPDVDLILDAAYNLNAIQANGKNIGVAIGRANNIVASLRNYARKGSQVKPILSDLRTGIDTVLTLYQNKLKHGIEVHKQYEDVPQLLCYPEELDQAWANLIGNAIQAMDGKGQLDIALTQAAKCLMITITDSGPGIPEEAQAQIFTPYFTTKPMGEGSGLGLSITQKIIQRHGGSIALDSSPGQTSFRISLPLEVAHNLEGEASGEPSGSHSADGFCSGSSHRGMVSPRNDSGAVAGSTALPQAEGAVSISPSVSAPSESQVPTVP